MSEKQQELYLAAILCPNINKLLRKVKFNTIFRYNISSQVDKVTNYTDDRRYLQMKEIRSISHNKVRNACIEHNWFTCGSIEEYEMFLEYIYKIEFEHRNITTNRIEHIANKIKHYSDTDYDVQGIMFVIANYCCKSYFV